MTFLDKAIRETLAYSSFFKAKLTARELHLWLIHPHQVSQEAIEKRLENSKYASHLSQKNGTTIFSQKKLEEAKRIASKLSIIPTISLIAVTGSVAVGKAKKQDDVDLLIVTINHTLWLTRPLVLILLSLLSRRRLPGQTYKMAAHSFCPNLWLEHRSLQVPKHKHSLYTAHEVLYVTPIFDRYSVHSQFIFCNSWVKKFLANAYHAKKISLSPQMFHSINPALLIFAPLNMISFLLQYLYMKPRITKETVSLRSAYFHTKEYEKTISDHLAREQQKTKR